MAKKTTQPLRARLESVAFVWYVILNLIGIAFVYYFQNWPMLQPFLFCLILSLAFVRQPR
jgi:hypothetical protein